jgi:hypothetical protein
MEKIPVEWRNALMARIEEAGDDWAFAILDLTSLSQKSVLN